ncbi:hypothetical protein GOP47_0010139 [Adiantum capillus-veneris]|uniref:FACT complex subunit SSRP1 n=1 Tax=Adiantum capillus-veneris TaxID=13818 RepID=A0A9D4UVB7_ADICA|nr:hypothetical protein GOP47_0010139 [Adiantum capillus-veneris]
MASENVHQFGNIMLGGRGGANSGQLKIYAGGFVWRKTGGGKVVEVSKADVSSLSWTRVPRGYQLGVRLKAGSNVKFNGFKEQDVSTLSNFMSINLGVVPEDKPLSVSGRNWGQADLNGNMLSFEVGGKQAFELSLADVSQTQLQGKNDVLLEFHVDDTTGANEKDCLMEMSFHVPTTNTTYVGDDNNPPAQVFCDKILSMADVASSAAEAVAVFREVTILTPRGRYSVELHLSFLRLQGQANDFKIQYTSVVRLFVIPKSNQPHTFVVISLDPPIRKGQTFYPHIVLQFSTDDTLELDLTISEDLLTSKYNDRLEATYQGLEVEVFAQVLRGLSGAKVTRPGKFRSSQDGYAVRASLKAEDGVLYPLEKAFFFLPKPPTLILHDEIDYLEFERHGAGGSSSHYFDLAIRLKSEQEHQFRNIPRNEYHNLFNFINSKNLKILNLGEMQGPTGVAAVLEGSDDETLDPHLERIKSARDGGAGNALDSDEEDEDFVAEKDDSGSPSDDSDEEGSDASEGGDEEKPVKEKQKEAAASKPAAARKKKREDGDDDGKKKRRKKDPNAPKRAMSSFMYFSQAEREVLKKTNPGLAFKEVGKVLGERWKKLSEEEKEPYENSAKLDKARYTKEMAEYKSGGQTGGNESVEESE